MTAPPGRKRSRVRFAGVRSNGGLTAGLPYSNALVAVSSRISVAHRYRRRRHMAMDPTARTEAVLIATYPDAMMFCAYCRQRATVNIPASPGRVCFDHAL